MNWLCPLVWSLIAAAAPAEERRPQPVVVREPAALAAALQGRGIVDCRLTARQLDETQQQSLRDWVAAGGTLWCETDLAALFGFETTPVTDRDRIGRARRACGYGAAGYEAQVEQLFYRFGPQGVLLVGHPAAVGLLEMTDPTVQRRGRPIVAAELWYGIGRVVHRPAEIHESRLDGKQFVANLSTFSPFRDDEVRVPIDQLYVAERNASQALERVKRDPDNAARSLRDVRTAFSLWLAEHLTAVGRLDEALPYLQVAANAMPEEPSVYLAVYHWNLKKGRNLPADEALAKAKEGYKRLGLEIPGPGVRQLRVPWPTFVTGLTQATSAADAPDEAACQALAARMAFLVGLDLYRAGNLASAAEQYARAASLAPQWPLPTYHLGLLLFSRGEQVAQPVRDRLGFLRQAGEQFLKASLATESEEFPAAAKKAADEWAKAAQRRMLELVALPLECTVTDHFILRYDGGDQRFQVGPTVSQLTAAWERAYDAVSSLGIWLDPVEVLFYENSVAMLDALPKVGAAPQVAEMVASVGRTIYSYPAIEDLAPYARHELTRVAINSLTEDGLVPPLWLSEGLATAMEQNPAKSAVARNEMNLGNVFTIQQLNDARLMYDRRVTDQAHGQAQVQVEALAERFGLPNFVLYFQQVGWGVAPETAFRRWTNLTQEQFLGALLQGRL